MLSSYRSVSRPLGAMAEGYPSPCGTPPALPRRRPSAAPERRAGGPPRAMPFGPTRSCRGGRGSRWRCARVRYLDRAGFDALLHALSEQGFRLIGPTVRDGAIVLDRIEGVGDLPAGVGETQGPGTYRLTAARRRSSVRRGRTAPTPASASCSRHASGCRRSVATGRSRWRPRPPTTRRTRSSGSARATCTRSRCRTACSWTLDPAYRRPSRAGVVHRRELRGAGRDVLLRLDGHRARGARSGSTSR